MKKVKFATIGTNFVTRSFLEAGAYLEGFELTAVYSRSTQNAKKLLEGYDKSIRIYTDLDELADDEEVDAVYVASPTACHMDHSIKMMNARKHVLCEKPIASNHMEWKRMSDTAKSNGVILMEAMRPLYHPAFNAIKEGLRSIGKIHMAYLNFCQYSSRYNNFKKGIIENAFRPELSNGALMDIGIYSIEMMIALFGRPKSLLSTGQVLPQSIDVHGQVIAIYDDKSVMLSYSKVSNSNAPSEIQGEEGTLYFDSIIETSKVWIVRKKKNKEVLFSGNETNDMKFEIQHFIDGINGKLSFENNNNVSDEAMRCTDIVRKQQKIVFSADLESGGYYEV